MRSFKEFLLEVFDNPWAHTLDQRATDYIKHVVSKSKEPEEEISNIKAHKLEGNNGHLISWSRNKALEVHHMDIDHTSGNIHNTENSPNPIFYSTMIHHLKTHGLDKGHQVRILSPKGSALSKRYDSITNKLAKKYGYRIVKKDDRSLGQDKDSIEIYPKGTTLSLEEFCGLNIKQFIVLRNK